jgi:transglutaminase-like putative cysteine protease
VIYSIRHVTTYRYDSEVAYARCILRLIPRTGATQTLLQNSITVDPKPAAKIMKADTFGDSTVTVVIATPHRRLVIDSRSRVDVHAPVIGDPAFSADWESVRGEALRARGLDPDSPTLYLYPTPATPIVPAITEYARASFAPGRPVIEAAADLMQRIKREFAYDPQATEVSTPVSEAFQKRRGVCQDFAQIMISGLRGLGLSTRYVSGYLRTVPRPGQPRLEGADATHAWVSVWCGADRGWIGLDPTNNMFTENHHIILTTGRDYQDVAPIEGVLLGAGRQRLKVEVDVEPEEEAGPAADAWMIGSTADL